MTGLMRPGQRMNGKNSAQRDAEGERALDLRNRGVVIAEIARQMGISPSTVYERIDAALATRIAPRVDLYRKQQNDSLDMDTRRVEEQLLAAENILVSSDQPVQILLQALAVRAKAIDQRLKISERRSKLNGLDAPQKVEAAIEVREVSQEDLEIAEMIREAQARAAREEADLAQG